MVRYIRRGKPEFGFALFESEYLKWPEFVEFDDVNGNVLTYSAQDRYFVSVYTVYLRCQMHNYFVDANKPLK